MPTPDEYRAAIKAALIMAADSCADAIQALAQDFPDIAAEADAEREARDAESERPIIGTRANVNGMPVIMTKYGWRRA